MSSAPPLDIKVLYSASSRGRRRKRGYSGTSRPTTWVLRLGLLNLLVAGGQYYGTWWWVDPNLRVMLIMHTEFGGVDTNAMIEDLIPDRTKTSEANAPPTPSKPKPTPTAQGLTSRGMMFVGTAVGWRTLSTFAILALTLSAGALLRRGGSKRVGSVSVVGGIVALVGICAMIFALWSRYGKIVPDETRWSIAALGVVALLLGLFASGKARSFSYVAAVLMILSAGGTAWGLHVGAESEAIEPKYATIGFLALAFGLHSLWGWILLPLSSRLRT